MRCFFLFSLPAARWVFPALDGARGYLAFVIVFLCQYN